MFGKKQVIFLVVVMLVTVASLVMAGEELTLKPSQALDLALENNIDLQIAAIQLENSEIDYKKSTITGQQESQFDKLQLELQIDQARNSYNNTEKSLIIGVFDKYLNILKDKEDIAIEEKKLNLQERRYELAEARYEAGHIGELDFRNAKQSYENAKRNLEYLKNDLDQTLREFKNYLGLENDQQLILLKIETPEVAELDETEVIEQIIDNNFSLEVDRRRLELAEMQVQRARVSSVPELDLQKIKNDRDIDALRLQRNEQNSFNSAQAQYNSFQRVIDQLENSQINLEQTKENFAITEKQYQAGIKTENDYLSAEISLLEAENNYYGAVVSYYISELNLKESMGLDIGRVYDESVTEM